VEPRWGGYRWRSEGLLQLSVEGASSGATPTLAVASLQSLVEQPGVLAAALAVHLAVHAPAASAPTGDGATLLHVPPTAKGGVVLVDVGRRAVLATLDAHSDVVCCLRALPNGGLATAGGKHDGTVRVWARTQWESAAEAPATDDDSTLVVVRDPVQTLREPGYVTAMTILPDDKPGSQLFALACARYNTVKFCL